MEKFHLCVVLSERGFNVYVDVYVYDVRLDAVSCRKQIFTGLVEICASAGIIMSNEASRSLNMRLLGSIDEGVNGATRIRDSATIKQCDC